MEPHEEMRAESYLVYLTAKLDLEGDVIEEGVEEDVEEVREPYGLDAEELVQLEATDGAVKKDEEFVGKDAGAEVDEDIVDQAEEEADEVPDEEADGLQNLPFLTCHYLVNYLWITAEAACIDFSNSIKAAWKSNTLEWKVDWESESWRHAYIEDPPYVDHPETLELEQWARFINKLPEAAFCDELRDIKLSIAASLNDLRLSAVHRMHISKSTLTYAIKLPQLLYDWQRAHEVEHVVTTTMVNAGAEQETDPMVETLLYNPIAPHVSALQVASHILRLLEECCYRWSKRNDTEFLQACGWNSPEAGELQIYREHWTMGSRDVRPSPELHDCDEIDGQLFSQVQLRCKATKDGRELRDAVSHRHVIEDWHIRRYAQSGIILALLCDDRENALEIEIITEQWLTKRSRDQVLARLHDYYQNHPDQSGMKDKRQSALKDIIKSSGKGREDRTKYTNTYLSTVSTSQLLETSVPDCTDTQYQRQTEEDAHKEYRHFDSLSKESTVQIYRAAVEKFVDCDSMHASLRAFKPNAEIPLWMREYI